MAGRTIKTSTPLEPYKQGETAIEGQKDVIKLSSNELPYPPSPAALQAFVDAQAYLSRYPDGSQFALREAISKIHGISANNIFAGNGSEEAIGLVIRSVLSPSDEMIISENSFQNG
ncbi:MAG: aminotransferase class I/II-fold pyridoxal phosphate-dependent enzyme [Paracoccaceae bacterium]